MYQRDYIVRLIEQLGRFVAQILEMATRGKHDSAAALVEQGYHQAIGVGGAALDALGPDSVVTLLPDGGENPLAVGALGRLIAADAALRAAAGEVEASLNRWRLAAALIVRSGEADPVLAAEVADGARRAALSAEDAVDVAVLYERAGRLSECEDVLFDALDAAPDVVAPVAMALYERLLALGDAELAAGGLPRPEVEMGLEAVRGRLAL